MPDRRVSRLRRGEVSPVLSGTDESIRQRFPNYGPDSSSSSNLVRMPRLQPRSLRCGSTSDKRWASGKLENTFRGLWQRLRSRALVCAMP